MDNSDNPVVCLCWNCGREIHADDTQHMVNDEIWCDKCAEENGYETESV